MFRSLLCCFAALLLVACSEENNPDAGTPPDAGELPDGNWTGEAGTPSDTGIVDAGLPDSGAWSCDPLAPPDSPTTPVLLTGLLDITDFDFYEPGENQRFRVRNAGFNFFTGSLPAAPLSHGALYTAIPEESCVIADVLFPGNTLGDSRNVGTSISITNVARTMNLERYMGDEGPLYRLATQMDTDNFFDPEYLRLDSAWTWSTPGDEAAEIRAATATVAQVEDFQVTPAFTSSAAALVLDPNNARITWTPPINHPGIMSIVAGRASVGGDVRYLICRPVDDGEFVIDEGQLNAFNPMPGLAFDFAVSRAAIGGFCNEGTTGAAIHALVYSGTAVVN